MFSTVFIGNVFDFILFSHRIFKEARVSISYAIGFVFFNRGFGEIDIFQ